MEERGGGEGWRRGGGGEGVEERGGGEGWRREMEVKRVKKFHKQFREAQIIPRPV